MTDNYESPYKSAIRIPIELVIILYPILAYSLNKGVFH